MSAKSGPAIPNVRGGGYKPQSSSNVLTYVLVTIGVIAVAALVIGGVVLTANRDKNEVDPNGTVATGTTDMTVGESSAPVTIDIFEDPICPACGSFERSQGPDITAAIKAGKLRARFHMLNFLNNASPSQDYSTRAGAALQCVAGEKNQELFLKFHSALFTNQPAEGGSSDHSNADLAKLAGQAGASDATQRCISTGAQVAAANKAAQESMNQLSKAVGGNVSTPSVLLEGKKLDLANPNWLNDLLNKNPQ